MTDKELGYGEWEPLEPGFPEGDDLYPYDVDCFHDLNESALKEKNPGVKVCRALPA